MKLPRTRRYSRSTRSLLLVGLMAALLYPAWTFGDSLTLPHVFSDSQPIKAQELNANFAAVKASVDDNASRIAGLSSPRMIEFSALSAPPSGGGNAWVTDRLVLVTTGELKPAHQVSGQTCTVVVRIQTSDSSMRPGPPLQAGNLVLDLNWVFSASTGSLSAMATTSALVTIPLPAGVQTDKTFTVTTTVPDPPKTTNGFNTTHLQTVALKVNPATTAQGQGLICLDISIPMK